MTGEDSKDLEVFFFQPPQGHSKKVHRIFIRNKKKDIDTDISSLKIIRNIVKNLIPINFKTKKKQNFIKVYDILKLKEEM